MNKKLLLTGFIALAIFLMFSNSKVVAQNIAINSTGTAANASSMLDISSGASSNRGLLIPRVTSAQKTAMNPLPAAAQGLTVYQTDGIEGFYYNTSTTTTPAWSYLSPSTGWSILGNAGTAVATNFLGTTDAIDFAIRTNNTERIRVTSAGNVGIGLTNPIYNLEINGTFGYGDGIAGTYRSRTESRADAGLQGSSGAQSGFFQTSAPAPAANWPTGAASWWHLLDVRHSNDANNYAMQFAGSFFDQRLYFRKTNSAANTAWSEVLTSSATIGQSATSYFNDNAVAISTATFVYASGYPVNITVPAGYTVILSGDIGVQTSSAATTGYSLVDVVLTIDGVVGPTDGAWQRITAQNNGGVVGVFEYASFSQAFTLSAGVHTVGISGRIAGGSAATFGGNSSSVLQGELTVTMIKN